MSNRRGNRDGSDDEDAPLEELPKLDESTDTIVVVDGLPVVGKDKVEKLSKVIKKLFSSYGNIINAEMSLDKNDNSKGVMFIEYESKDMAEAALAKSGEKLDQDHTLNVNRFADIARLANLPPTYVEPSREEARAMLPASQRENLRWWLQDSLARDQYVIKYGDDVAVVWNDSLEKPVRFLTKSGWTETYCQWSPLGTYLVTFHQQGIILWAGKGFEQAGRFAHKGVKLIDFSPKENFVVTWSNIVGENDESLIFWEVKTGAKLRAFAPPSSSANNWPVFKWESTDTYFAALKDGFISVYESSSMKLLDKKKINVANVKDFSWSPTDPVIACWMPEEGQHPARVALIEIPSRREIRQKNLFNVTDCKLHWQNRGDYLAVRVDRTTKSGKTAFVNFEFFRMREKDIPIESLEIKDTVAAFEWEPTGDMFAMIHSPQASAQKPDISFYQLSGGKLALTRTLEKKSCNSLYWSPRGRYIVLAGLGTLNGTLEFWNAHRMEMMAQEDHFMCTAVDWEPAGRYVATAVSYWRHQLENGYNIWNFSGHLVHQVLQEKFYQLVWRPRPPSLLTEEDERTVRKQLHTRTKEYEKQDFLRGNAVDVAARARRQRQREEFESIANERAAEVAQMKAARDKLRGASGPALVQVTEMVEEVLEETIELDE